MNRPMLLMLILLTSRSVQHGMMDWLLLVFRIWTIQSHTHQLIEIWGLGRLLKNHGALAHRLETPTICLSGMMVVLW